MTRRACLLIAACVAATAAGSAGAVSLPERTFRVSSAVNGTDADGRSSRPALSPDGRTLAFDSQATNLDADLNGAVRDVFLRRLAAQRTILVSEGTQGAANGASHSPAISGETVAFVSEASNLVDGDSNGKADIFVREIPASSERISITPGGVQPDADSSEPDISPDGRFVAFTSAATNLAPQDANGDSDVFIRDRVTGALERVSDIAGRAPSGRSRGPAVSATGRYVAFASTAPDLVAGDTNGVEDVFVVDRLTRAIERVSVSTGGAQQEAAVSAPFSQVVDISDDGRYVAFDSDATNLVRGDRNSDTDVFVRDRLRSRTRRVSVDSLGIEGDNDSFYPSVSGDGRHVAFNSFADNLAPGDNEDENVFVHDLDTRTTVLVDVTESGERRDDEVVDQLLQRPSISRDGGVAGFTSTAGNVVAGDNNSVEDAFVRVMAPPLARFVSAPAGTVRTARPRFRVGFDDAEANRVRCTIDGRPFECDERGRVPRVGNGSHVLRVRAGGPGMLFQEQPTVRRFRVAGVRGRSRPLIRPRVRITAPKGKRFRGAVVAGRAKGGAGVVRVEVLVAIVSETGRCRFFDGTGFVRRSCRSFLSVVAEGTSRWRLRVPSDRPKGLVVLRARAVDSSGNRSKPAFAFGRVGR